MKSKFNFKNWLKAMGVTLLVMLILDIIPGFPPFLLGWLCCMTFEISRSYFTDTVVMYVPKDKKKIIEDYLEDNKD